MNLVVDTSVWSLVLRRPQVDESHPLVVSFRKHIEGNDDVFLLGCILQELLDGLRNTKDFDRLRLLLEPFPMLPLNRTIYVEASALRQRCRSKGVQASPIDCLISAACIAHQMPLLTADSDFILVAKWSELVLLTKAQRHER